MLDPEGDHHLIFSGILWKNKEVQSLGMVIWALWPEGSLRSQMEILHLNSLLPRRSVMLLCQERLATSKHRSLSSLLSTHGAKG